ncbi:MAG: hypothetical protein H6930_09505 [Rhodoferax sp.]|nr:hypothetical protein [Rhodoferax sp.]
MARDKASLIKQHRNVIMRTDVLAALGLSDDRTCSGAGELPTDRERG